MISIRDPGTSEVNFQAFPRRLSSITRSSRASPWTGIVPATTVSTRRSGEAAASLARISRQGTARSTVVLLSSDLPMRESRRRSSMRASIRRAPAWIFPRVVRRDRGKPAGELLREDPGIVGDLEDGSPQGEGDAVAEGFEVGVGRLQLGRPLPHRRLELEVQSAGPPPPRPAAPSRRGPRPGTRFPPARPSPRGARTALCRPPAGASPRTIPGERRRASSRGTRRRRDGIPARGRSRTSVR